MRPMLLYVLPVLISVVGARGDDSGTTAGWRSVEEYDDRSRGHVWTLGPEDIANAVRTVTLRACSTAQGVLLTVDLAMYPSLSSSSATARVTAKEKVAYTVQCPVHAGEPALFDIGAGSLPLTWAGTWASLSLLLTLALRACSSQRPHARCLAQLREGLLLWLGLSPYGKGIQVPPTTKATADAVEGEEQHPDSERGHGRGGASGSLRTRSRRRYSVLRSLPTAAASRVASAHLHVLLATVALQIIQYHCEKEGWLALHLLSPKLLGVAIAGIFGCFVTGQPQGGLDGQACAGGGLRSVQAYGLLAAAALLALCLLLLSLSMRSLVFGALLALLAASGASSAVSTRSGLCMVQVVSPTLLACYATEHALGFVGSLYENDFAHVGVQQQRSAHGIASSLAVAAALLTFTACAGHSRGSQSLSLAGFAKPIRVAGLLAGLLWLASRQLLPTTADGPSSGESDMAAYVSLAFVAALTVFILWVVASVLADLTVQTSPRTAVVWLCLALALPMAVREVFAGSRSGAAALVCWLLQLRHLVNTLEASVCVPYEADDEWEPPQHWLLQQHLVDNMRSFFATALWNVVTRPVQWICSKLLPTELRFYAFEAPISDMGGSVTMGVCFLLTGEQSEPGFFVCNVGHIPEGHFNDVRKTVGASLEIMEELKMDAPGFVSNLLCVVPEVDSNRGKCSCDMRSLREINLSVWRNKEDAMRWYVASQAHRGIVQEHRQGGLEVFGNLLASMVPVKLRWQRRCQQCHGISDGLHADFCQRCGARNYPVPVF